MKRFIRKLGLFALKIFFPRLYLIEKHHANVGMLSKNISSSEINSLANISDPAQISCSKIDAYSYVSKNSNINMTSIGKFCSIGPNFFCGWGIHPTNGLSTSPVFYSTNKQAGTTFSTSNKIQERKPIKIGNDVFIGMNVTVLDGVTIGDGAIIGAGSVVSKDIPPYAVAVGSPISVIKYRFNDTNVQTLLEIKWWDFDKEALKQVEKYFFDVQAFIDLYAEKQGRD